METINAMNVNDAYIIGMVMLKQRGVRTTSRNGEVIEMIVPVATTYHNPIQRVLFNKQRDSNPFFHFMESLWMLAGRNDVEFVAQFAKRMRTFSDDGVTLQGAYGYRWRNYFKYDQLSYIVDLLRTFPDTRRAVLQMWNTTDLKDQGSKDLPCNTNIYFKIRGRKLQMTVCNRSNDIIWGCYGANMVQMSVLQEYVAARVGVEIGQYCQISDSFHAYVDEFEKRFPTSYSVLDPYRFNVKPYKMVVNPEKFDSDLGIFFGSFPAHSSAYHNPFFYEVAIPVLHAWKLHREVKDTKAAIAATELIRATDWALACREWLERRV